MNAFAVLHDGTQLERAQVELAALLSFRRRQGCAPGVETLLGIWIEPRLLADLPAQLELRDSHGNIEALPILETAGVARIWALCWLEAREHSAELTRGALLKALVEERPPNAPGRFIPVFFDNVDPAAVQRECARLQTYCGRRVGPPLYHDFEKGRLSPRVAPS